MTLTLDPLDLLGVGFGPSNLSVAVAARESSAPLRTLFVDRKPGFAWHEGLMLEGAEMQVSFLKDLVTQRNPRSEYSFLSYLAAVGRLAEFVNLRSFYPSRREFDGYYAWVASHFDDVTRWHTEVVDVRPGRTSVNGDVEDLVVQLRDVATGAVDTVCTRALVLAPGGTPWVPDGVTEGPRVIHASRTLHALAAELPDTEAPYHVNVVGAGQTAADVFRHVRRRYPNGRITWSIRGFGIRPEDDTHFVNELFLPQTEDWFFGRDETFRNAFLDEYSYAAHAGVSYDLIPELYREFYEDKVAGTAALRADRLVELTAAETTDTGAVARYRRLDDGRTRTVTADAVVLATGYRYHMPVPMLAHLAPHLRTVAPDRYEIGRDYAVATTGMSARVFLQGFAERSHGFTEVLLSLMPLRAARIVDAVIRDAVGVTR